MMMRRGEDVLDPWEVWRGKIGVVLCYCPDLGGVTITIVEGDPLDGLLLANWRDLVHLNFLSKIKINLDNH